MNDRKRRNLWEISLPLLLALTLLLGGCASKAETSQNIKENDSGIIEPALPEPEEEPEPELGFIAPLTGMKQEEASEARPIAVMINNAPEARPQSGLTHADIIWELLAEGGITRLVAVFQSDSFEEAIGPVRSIRPYLIELGETYKAVLAHAGASNDGYAILQQQRKDNLDEISNSGPFFWRESFRKAPHNLYTNLEKLRAGADHRKFESTVTIPTLPFQPEGETAMQGTDASKVEIWFSMKKYRVSYTYDAEKKLYQRFVNGEPHIDLNNEEQLAVSNLVMIGTAHRTLDDVGRLAVDLNSGGPAMVFQHGKVMEAEWVRAADGLIRIMKDGAEVPLTAGKSFYHIIPMKPAFAEHITIE
ncbi:DUF3048 domain-containing protein [Paenibacillaceae bacterium]|nr:DUF3048 domain-containing protein [Paenibacillaceae bacterium]